MILPELSQGSWKVQVLSAEGELLIEEELNNNRITIKKYVAKAKNERAWILSTVDAATFHQWKVGARTASSDRFEGLAGIPKRTLLFFFVKKIFTKSTPKRASRTKPLGRATQKRYQSLSDTLFLRGASPPSNQW